MSNVNDPMLRLKHQNDIFDTCDVVLVLLLIISKKFKFSGTFTDNFDKVKKVIFLFIGTRKWKKIFTLF